MAARQRDAPFRQAPDWRTRLRRRISWSLLIKFLALLALWALFPFLMPYKTDPASSLSVRDASSSHLTLFIMLICVLIFMPTVLVCTAWVFRVLRGKMNIWGQNIWGQSKNSQE
jgi:cytochrome bd-type quinol oxidase subunit 2